MDKFRFDYMSDSEEAFRGRDGICQCCGKRVECYHISHSERWMGWTDYIRSQSKDTLLSRFKSLFSKTRKYSHDDYILHLCYDCIASGDAAKKFGVKLNWVTNPSDEYYVKGYDEVVFRTPSCVFAKASWPVHCDQACIHIEDYAVDEENSRHVFRCAECGEEIEVVVPEMR